MSTHTFTPGPADRAVLDGAAVLDAVAGFLTRFTAFPSAHHAPTVALWIAHTWAVQRFAFTPRLVLDGRAATGKTRTMATAALLVARPAPVFCTTAMGLARRIAASVPAPTVLLDEATDVVTVGYDTTGELRAVLAAGASRGAHLSRLTADETGAVNVERLAVFAPVLLAVSTTAAMPPALVSRSIVLPMARRNPTARVENLTATTQAEVGPVRDALTTWVASVADRFDTTAVTLDGLTDRAAEVWAPLLTIADHAGGHWPTTARIACRHLTAPAGGAA